MRWTGTVVGAAAEVTPATVRNMPTKEMKIDPAKICLGNRVTGRAYVCLPPALLVDPCQRAAAHPAAKVASMRFGDQALGSRLNTYGRDWSSPQAGLVSRRVAIRPRSGWRAARTIPTVGLGCVPDVQVLIGMSIVVRSRRACGARQVDGVQDRRAEIAIYLRG